MSPEHAKLMAQYNLWMNEKIYKVCADIPDAELKRDRGAFFKSIHGTLNHIMGGDKVWLGRFVGEPFKLQGFDQILHEQFSDLRAAREQLDKRICEWANGLTAEKLESKLRYTSIFGPEPRSFVLWTVVTHFFNHQTHHRGQITTLLSQCNLDVGATDLIAMPGLVSIGAQ